MLIIGAKGFAKELLEILYINGVKENINFYDDISDDLPEKLYNKYPVIRTIEEAKNYFQKDPRFALGIGNPSVRRMLCNKFESLQAKAISVISKNANLGHFGNTYCDGLVICAGVNATNDIFFGKGCLINLNCTIGHDTFIGDFTEICPGVHISGRIVIGQDTFIGTGAVLMPGITIGKNVKIGAGAVVTKNIPDNVTAVGIPAKILE